MSTNRDIVPPNWISSFFTWYCKPELSEIIGGDLLEQYREHCEKYGKKKADALYFWNVLLFLQPFAIRNGKKSKSKSIAIDMYKNYLMIGFRTLIRHKGISFIKIFGLAVGMVCTILIMLYVEHQLSYDKQQTKRDKIVRLESSWVVQPPYLRKTAAAVPGVEEAVRFFFWYEPTLKYEERVFTVNDFALVDSTVFKVFDFDFIAGSPESAFSAPNSVVLTASVAKKLFPNENPIGKEVQMGRYNNFLITGVIADVQKFHMNINAFASIQDFVRVSDSPDFVTSRNNNFSIYLLLSDHVNRKQLISDINERAIEVDEYGGDPLILRDFNDIYFANHLTHENNTKHGNVNMLISSAVVGFFILLIACINFINLTIAKTQMRSKEIGIRKVSGAREHSLRMQFFIETFLVVFIAFVGAILISFLVLPAFNQLVGESLQILPVSTSLILILVGVLIATVFISGIYPAIVLAKSKALNSLKGNAGKANSDTVLSKALISLQYATSIFLIIATITVVRQLHFMQSKDLGIDHTNTLTFTLKGERFMGAGEKVVANKRDFKNQLINNARINGVTFLNQLPGKITNTYGSGLTSESDTIPFKIINADPDFIEIMDIEIIEGRNLDSELITDMGTKVILNEEAVRQLGLEKPVGEVIYSGGRRMEIIGVVKDFHYNSVQTRIEAMAIQWNSWTGRACVKLPTDNLKESLIAIERIYQEYCPGVGFESKFLEQSFAKHYEEEQRLEQMVSYFVAIAITLSCMGLFALTAFVAERKTKEIGIRRALGATNRGIIVLLSNNFNKWIVIANVIAWPAAYFLLTNWLYSFEYRIDLDLTTFVLSGIVAFVIAFSIVLFHGIKFSRINPTISLRHE